jgi:hypothetical protein
MKFPAGLRARLLQRRFLRPFARNSSSPIFQLSPLVRHFPCDHQPDSAVPESEWHSAKACVRAAEQARASVVWLGGTEPLFHPAIGEIADGLTNSGRYVFLHTSGAGLRKRIHEFKPVARFYFVFEMPLHNLSGSQSPSALGQTVPVLIVNEAIRVARLSGFHVCAHFNVGETCPAEIAAQLDALRPQHLDGAILSSGGACASELRPASTAQALGQISQLIPSTGWRNFSRLLEASYPQIQARPQVQSRRARFAESQSADHETGTRSACEETA